MGWGICHFHNNGNIIESFESKHAKQQAWLVCFDMVHAIMWLLTMYALFSVIGCASITQAIFQCKKATPFSWTHINQQCTGRFTFVAVVGGCIVVWLHQPRQSNQANSACLLPWAHVMLIKQPWRLQQLNVWAFLVSWSQFACTFAPLHLCTFASLLPFGVGFPSLLTFFSCCYHWFPMYDDSTKRNSHAILMASTSLECFHFFWNICIYIRTAEIQSSFHCALKQEQGKYCGTMEQRKS